MFAGTIDEPNDKTTFLFVNDEKEVNGFTYYNGKIQSVDEDTMKVFSCFKLSENRKSLGIEDGYQVILDLDTDFKHYFKDGKEDIEKLYFGNGEDACVYYTEDEKTKEKGDSKARMFKTPFGKFLSISFRYFKIVVITAILTLTILFTFLSNTERMRGLERIITRLNLPVSTEVEVQDIKNLIYSSPNLDGEEKVFLCNEELLSDVLPYYEGNSSSVLSMIRHYCMDIVDFSEKEKEEMVNVAGYYSEGNLLHIRDYESGAQLQNEETALYAGHERIHMLQANYDLGFISEAVAQIACKEYYLNSCNQRKDMAYDIDVRYTEVLMEIVGPEVIWDRVFRKGSDSLENAVRPYLNEINFSKFFSLLKKSSDEMENGENQVLLSIIGDIYRAKYGSEMRDNELIQAILCGQECYRTYFRKSLAEEQPSYYTVTTEEVFDDRYIEKMCDNNELECWVYLDFDNFEEWAAHQDERAIENIFRVFDNSLGSPINTEDIKYVDGTLSGQIELYDTDGKGTYMCDIMDALNEGKATISYGVWYRVSLEEFKANVHNQRYNIEFVDKDNGYEYWFNKEEFTLTCRKNEKVYVDEIVGQDFSSTKNTILGG